MRIAVTGASGHLGGNLVRALLARGDQVRAVVHHHTAGIDGLPVEVVHADVLDADALRAAFEGVDLVFHLAAWVSIDGDHGGAVTRLNTVGPRNAVEAAAACGVRRVVHFSSVHAIDLRAFARQVVDETTPRALAADRDPYDRSKALGEIAALETARERGLDLVVVRPTGCIGPWDFGPSLLGGELLALARGRGAIVDGAFDWVDTRDVAAGAIAAAERGRSGEIYLLGGGTATLTELAGHVVRHTGARRPPVFPMSLARLAAPVSLAVARLLGIRARFTPAALHALACAPIVSCEKARRELGYEPRPLAETARDLCAWFAEQGWLQSDRLVELGTIPERAAEGAK